MKTIFLGTTNEGKIREFTQALKPLPIGIETPLTCNIIDDIPETGDTFEENALQKAKGWAEKTGLPTLVDDSGLVIDALNGDPGVHSKRFFPGSDEDRNQHILTLLKNVPTSKRTARYICALVFYDPTTSVNQTTIGVCEGTIAPQSDGDRGFGYDPIFIPQGYSTTFGVLPDYIKAQLSHRAQALEKMLPYLKQWNQ